MSPLRPVSLLLLCIGDACRFVSHVITLPGFFIYRFVSSRAYLMNNPFENYISRCAYWFTLGNPSSLHFRVNVSGSTYVVSIRAVTSRIIALFKNKNRNKWSGTAAVYPQRSTQGNVRAEEHEFRMYSM